jgi:hypothetical protein
VISVDLAEVYWYRHVFTHYWGRPDDIDQAVQEGILILAVPAYATVGAVVASLRPKNGVGWLCLFLSVLLLVNGWELTQLALFALREVLSELAWSLLVPPLPVTLMLLIFPDGRLLSRRWWAVVGLASMGAVFVVPTSFFPAYSSAAELGWVFGILPSLVALLASVVAVLLRWRRSRGRQRQQIKLLAYTVALTVAAVIVAAASSYLLQDISGAQSYPTVLASVVALAGLALGIPLAIGVAILKHNLYDVDLFINRTLVYGALTATLAMIYVGAVVILQYVLGPLVAGGSQLAVVASTLVIAALFRPLRRSIQSFIDRRFYRRRYDARKVLEAFSVTLRDETDLDALNDDLVGVVRETMQPAHVSLWLRTPEVRR